MPGRRHFVIASLVLVALSTGEPTALAQCPEDGALMVGLSAVAGLGAGASTSLASSGIIAAADPDSEYDFLTGFLVGTAVTGGLSALYGVIDGSTGCPVVREQGGFAWSIPLTMGIVGSLLPLAIWGASDREEDPLAERANQLTAPATMFRMTVTF
ncbi:MAG TPA: hypothetical protein ENK57_18370 [Polyangiaceae bacterium]|nr:hypothetical protein [Polyangiaceae bacterium]